MDFPLCRKNEMQKNVVVKKIASKLKVGQKFEGLVLSDSMAPKMFTGDKITIEKVLASSLKTNDIIAYWEDRTNRMVAHRIIKVDKKNKKITTKGDNLQNEDTPIKYASVLGKVVSVENKSQNLLKKIKFYFKKIISKNEKDRKSIKVLYKSSSKRFNNIKVIEEENGDRKLLTEYGSTGGVNSRTKIPIWCKYYFLLNFGKTTKSHLFLGGGSMSTPTYLYKFRPKYLLTNVEIEKKFPKIAKKFFFTPTNKNFQVVTDDGCNYLRKNKKKFDVIFVDVGINFHDFEKKVKSCFYQKTTYKKVKKVLKKNGVLVINLISSLTNSNSKLFVQFSENYLSEFNHIEIFADQIQSPEQVQDIIIFASDKEIPIIKSMENYNKNYLLPKKYYPKLLKKYFSHKKSA